MGVRVLGTSGITRVENRSFQPTFDFFNYNNIMSVRKKGNGNFILRPRKQIHKTIV